MTADEIENIVRIQWAATHGSDPYIDDYYHQAVQAKLAGGTPHGRRHFAPSHPRDMPSHARAAAEPHAFLQVDALGRVPYSSIRRCGPISGLYFWFYCLTRSRFIIFFQLLPVKT